jgi:hypothetical protein
MDRGGLWVRVDSLPTDPQAAAQFVILTHAHTQSI